MIRGNKHKRKIALVHREEPESTEQKGEEASQRGVTDIKFYDLKGVSQISNFMKIPFALSERRQHFGVTVITKQVLINTTKNQ